MEPYRVLFPLGAALAILGTASWIAFGFGLPAAGGYPGVWHPDLMIGGFVYVFAAGFLMTAIPQFTGSRPCSRLELAWASLLAVALACVGLLEARVYFHALSVVSLGSLVGFCARRFAARTFDPPPFFVFVALGLFFGIAGGLLCAGADLGWLGGPWVLFGRTLYTQGMVLALILGVGSQLLPAIWGWSDLPIRIDPVGTRPKSAFALVAPMAALGLALLLGFALEAASSQQAGEGARALLVSAIAVRKWRLLRKPKTRGKLAFWLWISALALVAGLWIPAFSPAYRVHGLHLSFIAGFGLMTFMVASRVTLAHGGYGVRLELRSLALTVSAVLIVLSALTRLAAATGSHTYLHHLAYAAATWILAVVIWSAVFVPRMFGIPSPRGHAA